MKYHPIIFSGPMIRAIQPGTKTETRGRLNPSDPDYQRFLADAAKGCYCCPDCYERPCPACCAGGVCDAFQCTCDDEYRDDYEDEDA